MLSAYDYAAKCMLSAYDYAAKCMLSAYVRIRAAHTSKTCGTATLQLELC